MNIVDRYLLNTSTIALFHSYSTDFSTKIVEQHAIIHVRQDMNSIVKDSCLQLGFTPLDARRNVIAQLTNYSRKTPILFSDTLPICLIYTNGLDNWNNVWIAPQFILDIKNSKKRGHCIAYLANGLAYEIPCSPYSLKNLRQRGLEVLALQHKNMETYNKIIT